MKFTSNHWINKYCAKEIGAWSNAVANLLILKNERKIDYTKFKQEIGMLNEILVPGCQTELFG